MKRRNIRFKKAPLCETNEELVNPDRGWYQIHTFKLGEEISMRDREYTLNESDTLALVLINISNYKDRPLDERALNDMRTIFDFFKAYRIGMIVRITYDTEGKCMENEPTDEALIHEHICEIRPVLNEYADCIFVYQGLLVGNWGEMHSSQFLTPTRMKKLADSILSGLDPRIFFAVRRPSYVRILSPGNASGNPVKIGVFDDAIMASATHFGTLGAMPEEGASKWVPELELNKLKEINSENPYGGEALPGTGTDYLSKARKSLEDTAAYFKSLGLTYLNRIHDPQFIDNLRSFTWKKRDVFKGMGGYDYIGRHLGYRFVIRDVCVYGIKTEASDEYYEWNITIENIGFSKCFCETSVEMVSDSGGVPLVITGDGWIDLSMVKDKPFTFKFQTPVLEGNIYLGVFSKKNNAPLFFANGGYETVSGNKYIKLGTIK